VNLIDSAPHFIQTSGNQVIVTVGAEAPAAPPTRRGGASPCACPAQFSAPASMRTATGPRRGPATCAASTSAAAIAAPAACRQAAEPEHGRRHPLEGGNIVVDIKSTA